MKLFFAAAVVLSSTVTFGQQDMCSQINASIPALPPSGGTVDARNFTGNQSCSSNPFAGNTKPVTLLLGAVNMQLTTVVALPTPSTGKTVIVGLGESSIITLQISPAQLLLGSNTELKDLKVNSSLTSDVVFSQGTSNIAVERVVFSGGANQLNLNTVTNFRIVQTRHLPLAAPGAAIFLFGCDHGLVDAPSVDDTDPTDPQHQRVIAWPASTNALRAITLNASKYIDVRNPIIHSVDATNVNSFAGISFAATTNSSLTGGSFTNIANGDGVVVEAASSDITITGTVSSLNGNCDTATCAGTHGETGDGFAIFNSGRIHLTNCVANNNGRWISHPHEGIEIVNSYDVTVENCDASESGNNGVVVDSSVRVQLSGVSAQRNKADGLLAVAINVPTVNTEVQLFGGQYNDNGQGRGPLWTVVGMYFGYSSTGVVQGAKASNQTTDSQHFQVNAQQYGARVENTARIVFIMNNFRGNATGGTGLLDSVGHSPVIWEDGSSRTIFATQ